MKTLHNKISKESIIDILFIIIGSIISSIGINMFLSHAKLLSGGVTGIALIFDYKFAIPSGYMILFLNIPLFILSFKKLSRDFTLYSMIGTFALSMALILTKPFSSILNIGDTLLLCLYGGVISGTGFGLVFSHHGSTGGFDIITMVLRKKYSHLEIGKISFIINSLIVVASSFIFGISSALYTMASMYISSGTVDRVVRGLNQRKVALIVTGQEDEMANHIMKELKRGVTCLYGEGAYTKEKKKMLYVIVPLAQIPELKNIVSAIDDKAFISFLDASEVNGKGFKNVI